MSLKDRITEDMKSAMRERAAQRLGAIRLLLAAIKQKEVDARCTLDDVAVVAIIDRLAKQRKDSIAAFEQAARHDLADQEKAELAVLQAYLPERMDAAAIAQAVQNIVAAFAAEQGRKPVASDMGRLMAAAKAQLAAQADMAQLSAAVKAALAA